TSVATWPRDPPAPGLGPRRSEIPKAMSIAGTAMLPTSSTGRRRAASRSGLTYGTTSESSTPASAAMVIGLRVTLRNPVRSDGRGRPRAAAVGVEEGERDRRDDEQLQEQRRCHEGDVSEHVEGDREAEVARID